MPAVALVVVLGRITEAAEVLMIVFSRRVGEAAAVGGLQDMGREKQKEGTAAQGNEAHLQGQKKV